MSFFDSAKDFFGLGPVENAEDDAYYDDPQYNSNSAGSTAYDRTPRAERPSRMDRPTPAITAATLSARATAPLRTS